MPSFVRVDTKYNHIDKAINILVESSRLITAKTARGVVDDMKKSMLEPKHGAYYGLHQASAPGEPPAVMDKELYDSIQSVEISSNEFGISAHEKGRLLEMGTVNMAPRPWIIPVIEKWRPTFIHEFEMAFKALDRMSK